MQNTKNVHPAVLRRMRNYAIKQALSELSEQPDAIEFEKVAKRHMIGFNELKRAYHDRQKQNKV